MKFGPDIQFDKKKKKTSEKFNDDVMSKNCNINVIFPNYS